MRGWRARRRASSWHRPSFVRALSTASSRAVVVALAARAHRRRPAARRTRRARRRRPRPRRCDAPAAGRAASSSLRSRTRTCASALAPATLVSASSSSRRTSRSPVFTRSLRPAARSSMRPGTSAVMRTSPLFGSTRPVAEAAQVGLIGRGRGVIRIGRLRAVAVGRCLGRFLLADGTPADVVDVKADGDRQDAGDTERDDSGVDLRHGPSVSL